MTWLSRLIDRGGRPRPNRLVQPPNQGKKLCLTSLAMPLLLRQRLLLLVLLVAASHGDPSGDNFNISMCLLQSYPCGGVNISYPFYLADDTGVTNRYNNSYCGYPGLGILCEDGKPTLQLNGTDKYTVTDINNGKVSLAISEVVDDGGSCPRVDRNVTLPLGSWLDFPNSTVDYLVFFLGCTFTNYLFQPPTIDRITCENFYTGPGLSFVLPRRDVPPGNWSQACERVIEVPVLKYDWPPINPNDPAWRSGGYGKFLRQGFQLAWDRTRAALRAEDSQMCPPRLAMAHLPCLLALPFLFLGFHVLASHGSPLPPTYDGSICSKSFKCGSINISYPFYLSNATKETADYTPYSCGYTDLKISCQGEGETETPMIQLGGDSYTVLSISYNNYTIILADSDALGDGNDCPRVRHNVTFDTEWLHYNGSSDNLIFFFGCWLPPNPAMDMHKINCSGFNHPGSGVSFVFTSEEQEFPEDHELAEYCSQVFVAPVIRDHDLMKSNMPMLGSGGYGTLLKRGFELAWNRSTTDRCHLCEDSDGRCAYSKNRDFLGCLCRDGKVGISNCTSSGSSTAPPPRRKSKKNVAIIAGAVAGGVSALVVAGVIAIFFVRKRKQKKVTSSSKLIKYSGSGGTPRSRGGEMEPGSIQDLQTHLFSYEELEEATDSFNDSRELGDGGFGTVYKGFLRDGRVVAVKRLYNNNYRRVEQFMNEAAILSGLRHPNLVNFYGCTSSHSRELLLVYEFVPNGTVADHLHGHREPERALTWPLRLNIAVESAAALTYLHAIEPPIVHRDVKTNNILLDADFHVKVADFGLSRLFPLDVTHVSTAPQGTPGYVDPEYHQCYQLTDKSDVYSFGVVLVELISSKPAVDITRQRNEINLAGMAINKIQKCQLEQLVDLELGYDSDPATKKMMTMVAELAFRCLQQNGEMRPPIKEVLEVLRGIQDECVMEKDGSDKHKDDLTAPFSPDTVHAPWESRNTTPNTSQ